MQDQLLGAAGALGEGGAHSLANAVADAVGGTLAEADRAGRSEPGNGSALNGPSLQQPSLAGTVIQRIPDGVPTTMIPVPFPVTSPPPGVRVKAAEELAVVGIIVFAILVWGLPWFCIQRRCCSRCFQRWISRRLGWYFIFGLIVNLAFASCIMANLPDITVNDLFFAAVGLVETFSGKLEIALRKFAILGGAMIVVTMRRKIFALLGFDRQIIRADLRDLLTCFTMRRFRTIEVSLWRAQRLPPSFSKRSLFVRMLLGCNEPQHTRPHNDCTTSMVVRERVQFNYDPEDDTQKLSLVLKAQEVVSSAVTQMAPPAGLLLGAGVNSFTIVGPTAGAALGLVTAIGAANSLGVEVARADLSCAMINRLRKLAGDGEGRRDALSATPSVPWNEENFTKIELVPQGDIWLRIADVLEP